MRTDKGQVSLGSKRALIFILLAVLPAVGLLGCRFPTDIEHTMDRIQGGVLKVGVTENPPWVVRSANGAP